MTFLAIVGPSGAGKTTLMLAARKRNPRIRFIRSVTTRPMRDDPNDIKFYKFLSEEEFQELVDFGQLIENIEYAGHRYGVEFAAVRPGGMMAITEHGILAMREHDIDPYVVEIVPLNTTVNVSEARKKDDRKRAGLLGEPHYKIFNSHAPGGLDLAVDQLLSIYAGLSTDPYPDEEYND